MTADDRLAEPGSEALDLALDRRRSCRRSSRWARGSTPTACAGRPAPGCGRTGSAGRRARTGAPDARRGRRSARRRRSRRTSRRRARCRRRRRRVAPRHRLRQGVVELERGRSVAEAEVALADAVPGRRSPAMATRLRGATSARTTVERRQLGETADRPARTPPRRRGCAARRRGRRRSPAIPPAASGQPARCPRAPRNRPTPAVTGRSSGRIEWAATPANSAGGVVARRSATGAIAAAERRASRPKRAIADRVAGQRQRRQHVVDEAEAAVDSGGEQARPGLPVGAEAGGSSPRPIAPAATVWSSSGWASGTAGWIQRRPWRSSGIVRNAGEAMPSGWIAEHTSCTKPGSVSSALRVPPPGVGWPSTTRTRRPVRAIVIAATSPLGPDPMTTASYSGKLTAGGPAQPGPAR